MQAVMRAHRESIQKICSKDYSREQIEKYSKDIWERSVLNDHHYVVEVDGKVEGMCHAHLSDKGVGMILGLYFTPKIKGQGIAKIAINQAIKYLKNQNVSEIKLTSSLTAKGFYERMGFVVIRQKVTSIRGVEIESFEMSLSC